MSVPVMLVRYCSSIYRFYRCVSLFSIVDLGFFYGSCFKRLLVNRCCQLLTVRVVGGGVICSWNMFSLLSLLFVTVLLVAFTG
jgi:hypothetical protein